MAKDIIHDAVKAALENDGWNITSEHYTVRYEEFTIYPDMAAERAFAAQRGSEKIVVEVKSFLGRSSVYEVKDAIGQYVMYQTYLGEVEPERDVYLAISTTTYHDIFQLKAVEVLVKRFSVSLLVVNLELQEITEWIR